MFQFSDDRFTHMPFVAIDNDGNKKEFCCIQENKLWKLHYLDDGIWKRLKTNLPIDATECSPCADYIDGMWQISFIAGGYEQDRRLKLYRMYGINGEVTPQIFADVGFVRKNQVCFATRKGPIIVQEKNRKLTLHLKNVSYLYRVSFDPLNPNCLLISGEYNNGKIFSWIYKLGLKQLKSVLADGIPAYKCALFDKDCFYAKQEAGFEERKIKKAETLNYVNLPASMFINETEEIITNYNLEMELV